MSVATPATEAPAVDGLAAAIDELAALDPVALADGETVQALQRQLDRLEALTTRATASFEASGAWAAEGARSPAAWLALLIIALYRKAISPLLPPACRFVPSCSEYGYEAVARYGILAGGRLAIWRILRCNPFGGSGYDPVP